jgi:hypothetical protein
VSALTLQLMLAATSALPASAAAAGWPAWAGLMAAPATSMIAVAAIHLVIIIIAILISEEICFVRSSQTPISAAIGGDRLQSEASENAVRPTIERKAT